MRFYSLFFTALLSYPLLSMADQTILCDAPQGTRIDYFSVNGVNLQNNTFLMGRDKMSGVRPKIIFSDNKKTATFIITDAEHVKSQQAKTGNMQIVLHNDEQISFAGMVSGAPIMATYYPKIAALIYSQQSIWPGPDYQGARAAIFYSRCQLDVA